MDHHWWKLRKLCRRGSLPDAGDCIFSTSEHQNIGRNVEAISFYNGDKFNLDLIKRCFHSRTGPAFGDRFAFKTTIDDLHLTSNRPSRSKMKCLFFRHLIAYLRAWHNNTIRCISVVNVDERCQSQHAPLFSMFRVALDENLQIRWYNEKKIKEWEGSEEPQVLQLICSRARIMPACTFSINSKNLSRRASAMIGTQESITLLSVIFAGSICSSRRRTSMKERRRRAAGEWTSEAEKVGWLRLVSSTLRRCEQWYCSEGNGNRDDTGATRSYQLERKILSDRESFGQELNFFEREKAFAFRDPLGQNGRPKKIAVVRYVIWQSASLIHLWFKFLLGQTIKFSVRCEGNGTAVAYVNTV